VKAGRVAGSTGSSEGCPSQNSSEVHCETNLLGGIKPHRRADGETARYLTSCHTFTSLRGCFDVVLVGVVPHAWP
jgi:hypothetical protein